MKKQSCIQQGFERGNIYGSGPQNVVRCKGIAWISNHNDTIYLFEINMAPFGRWLAAGTKREQQEGGKRMYEDKVLTCVECGKEFVWTAGEQEFYASKGFTNEPKRCPECRKKRREAQNSGRVMYDAVCANCGKPCKVPFKPTEGRPVYCSECFAKMHAGVSQ